MVKLVDVASEANVSLATVSRALNNNDRVDPQLAARVRVAAEKLGYRPNYLARNLRRLAQVGFVLGADLAVRESSRRN